MRRRWVICGAILDWKSSLERVRARRSFFASLWVASAGCDREPNNHENAVVGLGFVSKGV